MKFTDALALFNRKERYWLLRNALGPGAEALDAHFRQRLHSEIGVSIPEDAWWAIDYHLDWLIGALHLVDRGRDDDTVRKNADGLVAGNQEDFDLIVAFDKTLILIEAKGVTSWRNGQIDSKIKRIETLLKYQEGSGGFVPQIFLVLTSPRRPESLKQLEETINAWPQWMLNNETDKPYWIGMDMALDGRPMVDGKAEFHKVVRCADSGGAVGEAGSHWTVLRSDVAVRL